MRSLTQEHGSYLLSVARRAIETVVVSGRSPVEGDLPPPPPEAAAVLGRRRGVFVTITDGAGGLRGCIGLPYPVSPLRDAVVHAAVGAATEDPRFPALSRSELDTISLEVSALTEPESLYCDPLELPARVRIGRDGLIVASVDGASGLLLPQVGTEMGVSPEEFLALTCRKAGLHPLAWQTRSVRVKTFQAEIFSEGTRDRTHPVGATSRS